jgi:hypothetical protein
MEPLLLFSVRFSLLFDAAAAARIPAPRRPVLITHATGEAATDRKYSDCDASNPWDLALRSE